jgi:hypothetical protein
MKSGWAGSGILAAGVKGLPESGVALRAGAGLVSIFRQKGVSGPVSQFASL